MLTGSLWILSLRKTFIVVFYVSKVGGDASYKFKQVLCCESDGILAFSVGSGSNPTLPYRRGIIIVLQFSKHKKFFGCNKLFLRFLFRRFTLMLDPQHYSIVFTVCSILTVQYLQYVA